MNSQKSILITGCSSGIGRCVAQGLKDRGYKVYATARKQQDVNELIKLGFSSVQLDLANSSSIKSAVLSILGETGGKLFALFNNAAYGQPGAVEDLSRNALRDQFEVNLFGTHELTSLIVPVMREQGEGRIIQNSSVLGFVALKYRGAYNSTKYALEGLSDTLRMELKETGIYISLIEPGPIVSNFRKNAYIAYKNYIIKEKSFYRDVYNEMENRFKLEGPVVPFTLHPDAVLKKVIHALESKRPNVRYYVTFPTYLFGYLKRVLPAREMDWLLEKI